MTVGRVLRWTAVAAIGLALVAPFALPLLTDRQLTVVDGGSMEPTLHRGDVLLTRPPTDDDLRAGRILVVGAPPDRYTHRVVEVDADGSRLRLQGDANDVPDPTWVPRTEVEAVLVTTITGPAATLTRTMTGPPGTVLLLAVLAVLLVPPPRTAFRRRPADPGPD